MTKNPMEEMLLPCPLDICNGSGEIPYDDYDSDSHNYVPGGTKPCPHVDTGDHDPELDATIKP